MGKYPFFYEMMLIVDGSCLFYLFCRLFLAKIKLATLCQYFYFRHFLTRKIQNFRNYCGRCCVVKALLFKQKKSYETHCKIQAGYSVAIRVSELQWSACHCISESLSCYGYHQSSVITLEVAIFGAVESVPYRC